MQNLLQQHGSHYSHGVVGSQANKSAAEGKASELVRQLTKLKAEKAAAYSRNLALEKFFELQRSQVNDRAQVSGASTCSSTNQAQAYTSISSEPATHTRSNPIHLSVDLDTLARSFRGQPLSPDVTRFSESQLENLDFADFARLWKEYISR